MRARFSFVAFSLACLLAPHFAQAQVVINAPWVWLDKGDPAVEAPSGKVWFRFVARALDPSTGVVRVACDDECTVYVNGKKVGVAGGAKSTTFHLNQFIIRGPNVIAVEASNNGGRAGLLVDGEIRSQMGTSIPLDTSPDWLATATTPKGNKWLSASFSTKGWKPVKVIAPHDKSPWRDIAFPDSYLDRYSLAPGFTIRRVAEPALAGSLVCMTWGHDGKLIVSREGNSIFTLIDDNKDGVFDQAKEYSPELKHCQGLCKVGDDLYAIGNGKGGPGLFRLPDANHDDVADSVEQLQAFSGRVGEHGPHDVVFGPDGWMYLNNGNQAWVTSPPEATTPVRDQEEGYLLEPKFEDGNGHASGIKAPGGTIWRFSPEGKKWWLETAGFRNEYDFGFNRAGDMFSFDSDMEWDEALPWYRPVRITHCIPGAEFGWRSGAAKWPAYYYDSLPAIADVGRGSPTGVVVYDHSQFPEKFRGSLLACDWSLGRIFSVRMKPDGASFKTETEVLASGNPLNVSDIEVARDGSILFTTGGRGTEGGVYRISYSGKEEQKPANASANDVASLVRLPQPQSAWAREIAATVKKTVGNKWEPELKKFAVSGKPAEQLQALTFLSQLGPKPDAKFLLSLTTAKDARVRGFVTLLLGSHQGEDVSKALAKLLSDKDAHVRRRACEAFVRSGMEAPVDPLLGILASEDRFARFAARLALERVPADKWRDKVLKSKESRVVLEGLLALHRLGPDAAKTSDLAHRAADLLNSEKSSAPTKLNSLRFLQLALLRNSSALDPKDLETVKETLAAALNEANPDELKPFTAEAARTLVVLPGAGATDAIFKLLDNSKNHAAQIHYALCLRYVKEGWSFDQKRKYLDWYSTTGAWEGGHSMRPYLANIVGAALEYYTPGDRQKLLADWQKRPLAAELLLSRSTPAEIDDFEGVVQKLIADLDTRGADASADRLVSVAIEALTKSGSASSQASLRKLYDTLPDRRDALARSLSNFPTAENREYLIRALKTGDATTTQFALKALNALKGDKGNEDETRNAILAGLRLGDQGGAAAVRLLEKWTGSRPADAKKVGDYLAHYQRWFSEKYPDAAPAEPPSADANRSKYTPQELIAFLESPAGHEGSIDRGRELFTKVNCVKCHKFGPKGEGVGPDLSGVRRRFQRKEILESILTPSQVISDQYRSVTIATEDGLVHTGMPVPGQNRRKFVLLLPDATRLELNKKDIAENIPATISVMPEGLVKDLSKEDFADLFAFLETSKTNVDELTSAAKPK